MPYHNIYQCHKIVWNSRREILKKIVVRFLQLLFTDCHVQKCANFIFLCFFLRAKKKKRNKKRSMNWKLWKQAMGKSRQEEGKKIRPKTFAVCCDSLPGKCRAGVHPCEAADTLFYKYRAGVHPLFWNSGQAYTLENFFFTKTYCLKKINNHIKTISNSL